jgi:hypothetical protein
MLTEAVYARLCNIRKFWAAEVWKRPGLITKYGVQGRHLVSAESQRPLPRATLSATRSQHQDGSGLDDADIHCVFFVKKRALDRLTYLPGIRNFSFPFFLVGTVDILTPKKL